MSAAPPRSDGYVIDVRRWSLKQAIKLAQYHDGDADITEIAASIADYVLADPSTSGLRRWALKQAIEITVKTEGVADAFAVAALFQDFLLTGQVPTPAPPPSEPALNLELSPVRDPDAAMHAAMRTAGFNIDRLNPAIPYFGDEPPHEAVRDT